MSSLYYTEFYSPNLQSPVEESGYWCENELEYYRGTEEQPVIRVVRRRNTANKKERRRTQSINNAFADLREAIPNVPKERRRTQSINNAFADLREAIPNVPKDTKLSKIKTLRLATSYIGYLMGVLESEDCGDGFKADLPSHPRRQTNTYYKQVEGDEGRKLKGRTGWPQHVWALELKQETLSGGDTSH